MLCILFTIVLWTRKAVDRPLLIFLNCPNSTLVTELCCRVGDGTLARKFTWFLLIPSAIWFNVNLSMCFGLDCVHQVDLNIAWFGCKLKCLIKWFCDFSITFFLFHPFYYATKASTVNCPELIQTSDWWYVRTWWEILEFSKLKCASVTEIIISVIKTGKV